MEHDDTCRNHSLCRMCQEMAPIYQRSEGLLNRQVGGDSKKPIVFTELTIEDHLSDTRAS